MMQIMPYDHFNSTGTLSKAKGQILRVSACLHVLFDDQDTVPSSTIKEDAIKAAENYVDVCCQHVAYISGRGLIEDEVKRICGGMYMHHLHY